MKNILPLLLLTPITTNAECTPTPDCASIGYTQTSCEGDSLKCPFNTTMLKCMPCDSSFKYTCDGENVASVVGSACGGKYVSCECVAGAVFNNGACICDTSCKTIGNIVYSDKTCSSCVNTNKTAVAVVVHTDNNSTLILSLNFSRMNWSSSYTDILTLDNILDAELTKIDMNGKDNTKKIVEFMPNDNETNNSAWFCYNMELEGFEDKKGEWYLPAAGEIYNYYYKNYSKLNNTLLRLGITNFSYNYRSSSEYSDYIAWYIHSSNGTISKHYNKLNPERASCLLMI